MVADTDLLIGHRVEPTCFCFCCIHCLNCSSTFMPIKSYPSSSFSEFSLLCFCLIGNAYSDMSYAYLPVPRRL